MYINFKHLAAVLAIGVSFHAPVRADSPMVTDDATTLNARQAKLEGSFSKSGPSRGDALSFAYAPVENLELGIAHAQMRDASSSPATRNTIDGLAVKWIAFSQGPLSAGFKLEMARTGDDTGGAPSIRSTTGTGLLSYLWPAGYGLHANLGRNWDRSAGASTVASTRWSIGGELPMAPKLQLTGDLFGASGEAPGKQVGLRWRAKEGVKLFVGIGRSNSDTIANAGMAWEF